MTTREFLESLDWPACGYCQRVRADQRDHIVPKAMRRRHHIADDDARYHTPACMTCNNRKATFKVYPRGFDVSILPGNPKGWREWNGDIAMLRRAA